jgi:hypothetical protein
MKPFPINQKLCLSDAAFSERKGLVIGSSHSLQELKKLIVGSFQIPEGAELVVNKFHPVSKRGYSFDSFVFRNRR